MVVVPRLMYPNIDRLWTTLSLIFLSHCYHMGIDHWWESVFVWWLWLLCIIPSRIKSVSATESWNLGCCFRFSLDSEFWVLGCYLVGLTNNPIQSKSEPFYFTAFILIPVTTTIGVGRVKPPLVLIRYLLLLSYTPLTNQNPKHFSYSLSY